MSVKLVCNAFVNGEHASPLTNILNIVFTAKRASQHRRIFKSQSPAQTKYKLLFNLKSEEQNL